MAEVHPTWGRPIDQYPGSYTLPAMMEQLHSKMRAAAQRMNVMYINDGMASIRLLMDIGREKDPNRIKSMASNITLQHLQNTLDMTIYKGMIGFLTDPEIIQGCIKLMATVTPGEHKTASPLSYEYGYMCFRIAVISFSLSFTEPLLNPAYEAAATNLRTGRIHVQQIISGLVADSVKSNAQLSPTPQNKTLVREEALIVSSCDALCLLDMLWADRTWFLHVILETYTPGMIGVMYVFWQMWRNARQTSNDGDIRVGVPLYELLRRYHLGVTAEQDAALSTLLSDTQFLGDLWRDRSQLLDANDSKQLIYGYIHRVTTPENWHYKPDIHSIPPVLEFVVRFAQPGAEPIFPYLFGVTTRFLWDQIEGKQRIFGEEIANIIHIFHCLLKLLETMPTTSQDTMHTLVQVLVINDLVDLVARLIVLRRCTVEESDAQLVKNYQLIAKVQVFFDRLGTKIPQNILLSNFSKNLDEWERYRGYMKWCTEMLNDSEHHRRYCNAGWEVWRELSDFVNGGKFITDIGRLIQCSYTRCSHASLMPSMSFMCSGCKAPYCSPRCHSMDRVYAHGSGEHSKLCKINPRLEYV